MNFQNKHWWIVRLWRIVFLVLGFAALVLAGVSWVLTGNPQAVFQIVYVLSLVVLVTLGVYTLYSINIFGRMPSLQSRSFVYMCAIGLYMCVITAVLFVTSFLLLRQMKMPEIFVVAMVGAQLTLFTVIGYFVFIRLRRNM